MPVENLGSCEALKELGDSQMEDSGADLEGGVHHPDTGGHGSRKPNPRLYQQGVSMDLTTLEDSSDLRNHHHSIGNHLV